jgi:hypothetical protein
MRSWLIFDRIVLTFSFYELLDEKGQYWCEMCVFAPDGTFPVAG